VIVLLLAACAAFGAADQYVGSLTRFWPLAWEIPALSAPWLLLPFLVGRARRNALGASAWGAVGTFVALVAYGLMTISPIEHAHFSLIAFTAFARSNVLWFIGTAIVGPLFGYLGYLWAAARARLAASITAGAVLLEPLVHAVPYQPPPLSHIPLGVVTATEFAVGVAMVAWFWRQRSKPHRLLVPRHTAR
jgi:hypothetical protein